MAAFNDQFLMTKSVCFVFQNFVLVEENECLDMWANPSAGACCS